MNYLLILVLFTVTFSEPIWVTNSYRGVYVEAKSSRGYNFYPQAEKIKFKVQCQKMCDIFFTTYEDYLNYLAGHSYQWHYFQQFTLGLEYEFFDQRFINKTMTVFVINNSGERFMANYELNNWMEPLPWFNVYLFSGIFFPTVVAFCMGVLCCSFLVASIYVVLKLTKKKYEPLIQQEGTYVDEDQDIIHDVENQ